MDKTAEEPRQNRSGGLTKMGFKEKKSRNWAAGAVAAAIAVAWTIGGLVMPSMADTGTKMASVFPEVTTSTNQVNVRNGVAGERRFAALQLDKSRLFTTLDKEEARKHYGDVTNIGDNTFIYLPGECIVNFNIQSAMWDNAIEYDSHERNHITGNGRSRYYGAWVRYNGGTNITMPAKARSVDPSTTEEGAGDSQNSLTLTIDSLDGSVDSTEGGFTFARMLRGQTEPGGDSEGAVELSPQGDSGAVADGPSAGDTFGDVADTDTTAPSEDATEGGDDALELAPEETPAAVQGVYAEFKPNVNINVVYDPNKDKDQAMQELDEQLDAAYSDMINQFNAFVSNNNIPSDVAAKMKANLDAQFDGVRATAKKFLEDKYANPGTDLGNWQVCATNGAIVGDGALVLVHEFKTKNMESDTWMLTQKVNQGSGQKGLALLSQYLKTSGPILIAGQNPSFCVESLKVVKPGMHGVYPNASTLDWAKDDPEKAEIVKALAWQYFANMPKKPRRAIDKYNKENYARYQNAIWGSVWGFTEGIGMWEKINSFGDGKWVVTPGSNKELINSAVSEYRNRPNVISALENMHLDQTSLTKNNDGSYTIELKLNDYDKNQVVRDKIGDQVYIAVQGATYSDGTPIPGNRISLVEAEKGIALKVTSQGAFKIGFAGGLTNIEDAYFLDNPSGSTQGQVTVLGSDIKVSGDLKIEWTEPVKPMIGTTAKVDGEDKNPGQAEETTIPVGGSVTLTDDIQYQNLKAGESYTLSSTLTHKGKDGKVKNTYTDEVTVTADKADGTWTGKFAHEVKYTDVEEGDYFYYEETLKIYYDNTVIAEHKGENADQTVNISKSGSKLTVSKTATGDTAEATGTVTFKVTCGNTTTTLYAPAKGGTAATDAGKSVIDVNPGENCTVVETYNSGKVLTQGFSWSATNATPVDGSLQTVKNDTGQVIGSKADFTMGSAADISISVENNYKKPTGGFKVTKSVQGVDANTAANANGGKFDFTYTCDNGVPGESFSLPEDAANDTDNNPWTHEVNGLPVGAHCTVTETKPNAPAGYGVTVSSVSASGQATNTIKVPVIQTNRIDGVTFVNYYQPSDAAFSLQKVAHYANGDKADINENFVLHYECSGNGSSANGDVRVAGNGDPVAVNKGIKAGMSCTITEPKPTTISNATFKDLSFDLSGAQYDVNNSEKLVFKVPNDPNAVVLVTATNTYEKKMGAFKLVKKFNTDDNPLKNTTFNFNVTCGDYQTAVSLKGFDDPKTSATDNEWTSKLLPLGTKCTVTETDPSTTAAKDQVTWQGGQAVSGNAWARTVTIDREGTEENPTVTLQATNNVTAQYGKFSLKKALTGSAANDPAAKDATYPVVIECETGDKVQNVELKGDGTVVTTPSNTMLVGSKCTLHEDLSKVNLTGITAKFQGMTGATPVAGKPGYYEVTVPAAGSDPVEVVVNNSVDFDTANFQIRKIVSASQEIGFNPAEFRFTYACESPLGNFTNANNPMYKDNNPYAKYVSVSVNGSGSSLNGESSTILVPAGSTCTVTEIDPKTYDQSIIQNPNNAPVKYQGTTFQPAGEGMTSGKLTVDKGSTVTFAATNTYVDKVSGFQFNKTLNADTEVSNNNGAWANHGFNFGWQCQKPDGSKVSDYTALTPGAAPVLSPELPVNTKCVIWEQAESPKAHETQSTKWFVGTDVKNGAKVRDFDGVEHSNGYAFTIGDSAERLAITAENTFSVPYTSLTLDKNVVKSGDNVTVPADKVFNFNVSCDYTTGGTHTTSRSLTADAKPVTIETIDEMKIPVGSTCRVTEDTADAQVANHTMSLKLTVDGETVANGASFKLDNTKAVAVVAENTYTRDTGKFSIMKKASGAGDLVTQPSYDFDYTCTGDGEEVSGSIENVTAGSSTGKTSKDIPAGYTCSITERKDQKVDGAEWISTIDHKSFKIEKGQTFAVTANNIFSGAKGTFTLKKVIDPDSTASVPAGTKFNFVYSCTKDGSAITLDDDGKFSLEAGGTFKSQELPAGAKCQVTETGTTPAIPGFDNKVKFELAADNMEGASTNGYVDLNYQFGTADDTKDKFVIGKAGTNRAITATNKLIKKQARLLLKKEAEATSAKGLEDYSTKYFNRTYKHMTTNYVKMHVTCDSGIDKVVNVDVNGKVLDFGTVPYGSNCTVAELDYGFNDYNAFWYGGWRHHAEISVKDDQGTALATKVTYPFDMSNPDGEKAAIKFTVNTEADVTVTMLNRWDCFSHLNTVLTAPDLKTTTVNGVKYVDAPTDPKARVKLTDTVTYANLTPGWYTFVERLYSKNQAGKIHNLSSGYLSWTNERGGKWDYFAHGPLYLDGSGDVNITFTIDAKTLLDHPEGIAAGVALYSDPNQVGKQIMNYPDCPCSLYTREISLPESQSLKPQWNPEMSTVAINDKTNSKVLSVGKDVTGQVVTDSISYRNVAKGEYYLYGRVVQVDKPETYIGSNGKAVTLPELKPMQDGKLENKIDIDQAKLAADTQYVVFEYLLPKGQDKAALDGMTTAQLEQLSKDNKLAYHADASDGCQKLYTPQVRTNASIDKPVTPETTGTVEVKDKVTYSNLIAGKEYTLTGTLHVKNADGTDGGVLNDKGATKTITLTPDGKAGTLVSGEVTLTFTVNASSLKTKTVVAFEEVKDGDVVVGAHADITDKDQTIYTPSIGTTANVEGGADATTPEGVTHKAIVDMTNAKQVGDSKDKELSGVVITDTVAYNSIAPGEYVMYARLMKVDQSGKVLSDTPVTTGHAVLSIAKDGANSGTLDIKFPAIKVRSGEYLVAFEDLYQAGDFDTTANKPKDGTNPVASHAEGKDQAQTVTVPGVTTDAKDGDGDKYVDPTKEITIIDTVTGSGLIPGKVYTIDGELMIPDGKGGSIATGVVNEGGDVTVTADENGTFTKDLTFKMSVEKAKELGLWKDENGQPTSQGLDLVVFENLKVDGKPVAVHHDITDDAQTVHTGKMATSAVDKSDKNKVMVPGQKNAVITDTVTFEGKFEKNHNYTLVGELHYVTTGADGNKTDGGVVPNVTVKPVKVTSDADGVIKTQTMEFTVPAASIVKGKDMVVFETLHDGGTDGKVVIEHKNPADSAQTITTQENSITTTAYDGGKDGQGADQSDKNLDQSNAKVVIYDLVDYEGLEIGKEYTVTGTLHYQAAATLADGTQVKAGDAIADKWVTVTPAKFTAKTASSKDEGAVKAIVKFEVDKAALATVPVVVFEELKDGDVTVATHEDINDEAQVVYNPSLATTATVGGAKLIQLKKDQKDVTIDDEVTITNAAPGTYTLKGQLMAEDGKTVVATKDVKDVKVSKGETKVTVSFTVPAEKVVAGAKFVVFEELVDAKGITVADHKDKLSEAQTVRVGSLDTTATDTADNDHVADNTKEVTIADKVDYSGLKLDDTYADGTLKAYLVSGQLMDKATGKAVAGIEPVERVIGAAGSVYRVDGKTDRPVETVITSGTGSVTLEFKVPAGLILGKPVVVFETVYQDGKEYLIHHDIKDDSQTVWAPKLETVAKAAGERGVVIADADSEVKDTVTFSGMKVGETYVVVGELWNKTQNKYTGIKVTSDSFKAESATFTTTDFMTFKVPAGTAAEGDELVVFETLYLGDKPTGPAESTHQNPDDQAQTVGTGVKPGISTVLSADGNREAGSAIPTVATNSKQLIDTVDYWGLMENVQYRLDAELMEIGMDGNVADTPVATGSQPFTPTADKGQVKVTINLADGVLKPHHKYVAYETLVRLDQKDENGNDKKVTDHKNPKDEDQTVLTDHNPTLATQLTQDGKQVVASGQDLTLQDKVKMTGLAKDAKYVMISRLMYNAGQANEQVVAQGLHRFDAKDADQTETVKFTIPADNLKKWIDAAKAAGQSQLKLVAYEYLTLEENLGTASDDDITSSFDPKAVIWTSHADANDAEQTVQVVDNPEIGTTLKYGKSDIVWTADKAILTDTVEYVNLEPNKEYFLSGKLMGAKNPVQLDAEGNRVLTDTGIVGSAKFTTPAAKNGALRVSGTQTVQFEVSRAMLEANDILVAYESLYVGSKAEGTPITTHENPNDENQTVTVKHPGVGTIAKVGDGKNITTWDGKNTEDQTAPETQTITDTVRMYNVEVGKTYAIGGQVYDQTGYVEGTSQPLTSAAKTVKIIADMKVDATDAEKAKYGADVEVFETTMDLTVKASDLKKGTTLVVFEQLWAEGTYTSAEGDKVTPKGDNKPVDTHNDITSESQSITVNKPQFGKLTLTKTVTGWDPKFATVEQQNAIYKFTVNCGNKGYDEPIFLKEGETKTIEGIALGAKCIITEDVQYAVNQTGLKDTVKFTEANGLKVVDVENGKAEVMVGDSNNGTDTVANVAITADNFLTHEPVIGTDTSARDGKTAYNGETITDTVSYKHMPAGNYLLHTYFVEYVTDSATGKTVPQKIDYLESYATDVTVEGDGADGNNGSWAVNVTIPKQLTEVNKKVVIWEDLYPAPAPNNRDAFVASLGKLATGETADGLVAKHHENITALGEGYQWLDVSSNYGGFQVTKVVKKDDAVGDKAIPLTYNFSYKAVLPEGTMLHPDVVSTNGEGDFSITYDPKDPSKAVSPVFKGFPAGTEVTITETGMVGALPTGVTMETTWLLANVTDSKAKNSLTITIPNSGEAQVTAVNAFGYKQPTLATVANTAEGGKVLNVGAATEVTDTVTYNGLVKDRDYWLKTELVYTDDSAPVMGEDGQPIVTWTKVKAEAENGQWIVAKSEDGNPIVIPAQLGDDSELSVVFFESLFEVPENGDKPGDGDTPVVDHKNPGDKAQILTPKPTERDLQTTASLGDNVKEIQAGQAASVTDKVTYSGLQPGGTYTLVGKLIKKSDGSQVGKTVTVAGLTAENSGSGSWEMKIPLTDADTKGLSNGEALVVFEKAYKGSLPNAGDATAGTITPIVTHEDLEDASQTVKVVKKGTPPPPPETPGTPPTPPVSPSTTTPSTTPSTSTPPLPPVSPNTTIPPARPKVPPVLARTGAQAAMFGAMSLVLILAGAGVGLIAARRKREAEGE